MIREIYPDRLFIGNALDARDLRLLYENQITAVARPGVASLSWPRRARPGGKSLSVREGRGTCILGARDLWPATCVVPQRASLESAWGGSGAARSGSRCRFHCANDRSLRRYQRAANPSSATPARKLPASIKPNAGWLGGGADTACTRIPISSGLICRRAADAPAPRPDSAGSVPWLR